MKIKIIKMYQFPKPPKVLKLNGNNRAVVITRVYTEPAATGESIGWSDWTSQDAPYYKFKYTIGTVRVVFIVPKIVEVTLDEFSRAIERTRFFRALRKYFKYHLMEVEVPSYDGAVAMSPPERMKLLMKMFTKEEITAYKEEIEKFLLSPINLEKCTIISIDYVVCNDEASFDKYTMLPFMLVKQLTMTLEEWLNRMRVNVTLRDYVRLINELKNREARRDVDYSAIPADISNPFRMVTISGWFTKVLKELNNKGMLRPEWAERLKLFILYHRHFVMESRHYD